MEDDVPETGLLAGQCKFCHKSGGPVVRFCTNCSEEFYVHKQCAEREAIGTGLVACGEPCPAKYEIVYLDGNADAAIIRRAASTFNKCTPTPKRGVLYNCLVVKPVLLLLLACACTGTFLYAGAHYEDASTIAELLHMVGVSCVVIACFLFERDIGSYTALYRSIMRVQSEMGMEICVVLITTVISFAVVSVFKDIWEVDAIFGGWVFATNLLVLPALLLYLLWTRIVIYLKAPTIRITFNRVFEEP